MAISEIVAQSAFESAYIITRDNDTINGYILEKTDAEMARKIQFKTDKNSVIKTFRSNELSGFGFDHGRVFQQIPALVSAEDTVFVFGKKLVEGRFDLLVRRYAHQSKPDIFLLNNSTNELISLIKTQNRNYKEKDSLQVSHSEISPNVNLSNQDSSFVREIFRNKKSSEKKIKSRIIEYNRKFEEKYPVKVYREQVRYNYDILAGLPLNSSEELHFRVGVYRQKSRVERTTNFSFMQGLVYHHRSNAGRDLSIDPELNPSYRWHLLNIIPLGINFHGNTKIVQPYGYAGLGLGVIMEDEYVGVHLEQPGTETDFQFLPTLNVGMGLKFRLGKTSLITELTPTLNSLFWNVGISL